MKGRRRRQAPEGARGRASRPLSPGWCRCRQLAMRLVDLAHISDRSTIVMISSGRRPCKTLPGCWSSTRPASPGCHATPALLDRGDRGRHGGAPASVSRRCPSGRVAKSESTPPAFTPGRGAARASRARLGDLAHRGPGLGHREPLPGRAATLAEVAESEPDLCHRAGPSRGAWWSVMREEKGRQMPVDSSKLPASKPFQADSVPSSAGGLHWTGGRKPGRNGRSTFVGDAAGARGESGLREPMPHAAPRDAILLPASGRVCSPKGWPR